MTQLLKVKDITWIFVANIIMATILLISIGVVGFLLFVDGEYVNAPLLLQCTDLCTLEKEYAPGDVVSVKIKGYIRREHDATIQWTLMDSRLYTFVPKPFSLPRYEDEFSAEWFYSIIEVEKIPILLPPETNAAYFVGVIRIRINVLKTKVIIVRTKPFRVGYGTSLW